MNDLEERSSKILSACMKETSKSPYQIFRNVANMEFVRMHGPEHHVLDGACILTAFRNAGGNINLEPALKELLQRGLMMPGAMCGMWGVCGATASVGAALSILDGTGPLTTDDSWGSHMEYTSAALKGLSEIGGPRCCKRDAYISLETAIKYIQHRYGITLDADKIVCEFHSQNKQCKKESCPYYPVVEL